MIHCNKLNENNIYSQINMNFIAYIYKKILYQNSELIFKHQTIFSFCNYQQRTMRKSKGCQKTKNCQNGVRITIKLHS